MKWLKRSIGSVSICGSRRRTKTVVLFASPMSSAVSRITAGMYVSCGTSSARPTGCHMMGSRLKIGPMANPSAGIPMAAAATAPALLAVRVMNPRREILRRDIVGSLRHCVVDAGDSLRPVRIAAEVEAALSSGRAVVALESTIIAHGLPRPDNLRVAREIEAAVRDAGAVPATIAVLGGEVRVGLGDAELERIGSSDDVAKCSLLDPPVVCARGGDGATTVAATAHLAARAGVGVFATGGIGGVHRDAASSFDESADLVELSRTPICVVCAGVKSILDAGATLERLETLGVTVVGYRTDRLAGFYLSDSGLDVPWRAESPAEIAAIMRARADVDAPGGVLVTNPLPPGEQLDPALHDRVLEEALAAAERQGIHGKAITPFLLDRLRAATEGDSLRANVALVLRNAALAGEIAVAAAAA